VFFNLIDENGDQLITYKTAQNMAMFPENTDADTNTILAHLGVSKDDA